jgi:hypothetical protein
MKINGIGRLSELFFKKKAFFIAAAVIIIAGAVLYLTIRSPRVSQEARDAVSFEEKKYSPRQNINISYSQSGSLEGYGKSDLIKIVEESEQITPLVLMAEYKLIYRYPLSSRPLTEKMSDLLDPWAIDPYKIPIYENDPPREGEQPVYYYTLSTSSFMVTGRKPAVAKLAVFEPASDRPAAINVNAVKIFSDPEFGTIPIGDGQHSKDADGYHTLTWTPQIGPRNHWGKIRMQAGFRAPNGKLYEAAIYFDSTPNPPAVFTGKIRDFINNGSLKIAVEVEVKKEGKYIVEANLFDDRDKPLHWVYINRYLEKGRYYVDLEFFGLIFHDRGFIDGNLSLRNLRGYRVNLPYDPRKLDEMLRKEEEVPTTFEPEKEWMEPYYDQYITSRPYGIDEFSKSEYEGADKADRLRVIREYAEDWERAHGAGPGTEVD